jgi:hypothetical protein
MKAKNRLPEEAMLATYTIGEVAHYLRVPPTTVRAWAVGRRYPTQLGPRRAAPVLAIPSKTPPRADAHRRET